MQRSEKSQFGTIKTILYLLIDEATCTQFLLYIWAIENVGHQRALIPIRLRKPHKCQHCHRQARHGCNLCRECSIQRNQQRALRSEFLINQGCPYILGKTKGTFRWHQKFPELALWMLTTLNLREDPPLKHSRSKTVEVLGWKEGTDMNEARSIDGMILIRPY